MLTPVFHLSQSDRFITVEIRAPYAKITETEIDVDGKQLMFYSKPYYLRLHFSGELLEEGSSDSAKYDVDEGVFTVKLQKANPGEIFQDLDMLTKLLTPPGSRTVQSLVELVGDEGAADEGAGLVVVDETDEINWYITQTPQTDQPLILIDQPTYGFGNTKSAVFTKLQDEFRGVVDLPDPDHTPVSERRNLRVADEQTKFDEDHYLADYFQTDVIEGLLQFTPLNRGHDPNDLSKFTDDEEDQLRRLPRKEYLLDEITTVQMLLALVDILFSYSYNHRITEGENSVESSWTVCKLSPTLSWFDRFTCVHDTVIASFRRSLCFPLHRNWLLSSAVLDDVKYILKSGRVKVLKCLLEIKTLLVDSDLRYVLNDLYITDFCVWLQSLSESKLEQLCSQVEKVDISKDDVELDVRIVEQAGELALTESHHSDTETEPTSLSNATMAGLVIENDVCESDGGSTSSDEDDSSSETDSSSSDIDTHNVEAVIQATLNLNIQPPDPGEETNKILIEEL